MPDIKTEELVKPDETVKVETSVSMEGISPIKEVEQVYHHELDKKLTIPERIVAFIASRKTDNFVPLNAFLKSLYPVSMVPVRKPEHERVTSLATLRHTLVTMEQEGKIIFSSRSHKRLGENYYASFQEPVTQQHNLNSLIIEARLP